MLSLLFADLSRWQGGAADFESSPRLGVLRLSAEHPSPGFWLHFSGWDHYGVDTTGGLVKVGVWKTDDASDPYFRQGMFWTLWPDGRQERSVYLPLSDMPRFPAVRRGQWVSDDVARSVGLL